MAFLTSVDGQAGEQDDAQDESPPNDTHSRINSENLHSTQDKSDSGNETRNIPGPIDEKQIHDTSIDQVFSEENEKGRVIQSGYQSRIAKTLSATRLLRTTYKYEKIYNNR